MPCQATSIAGRASSLPLRSLDIVRRAPEGLHSCRRRGWSWTDTRRNRARMLSVASRALVIRCTIALAPRLMIGGGRCCARRARRGPTRLRLPECGSHRGFQLVTDVAVDVVRPARLDSFGAGLYVR